MGKIGGKRIAEDLSLAAPFVGKVLQPLAQNGILQSTKGPHGGFLLAKKPTELTLLEVIQIFDGNDAFKECLLNSCSCKNYTEENGRACHVHEEIAPARELLFHSFQTKTIADFLKSDKESKEVLATFLDKTTTKA